MVRSDPDRDPAVPAVHERGASRSSRLNPATEARLAVELPNEEPHLPRKLCDLWRQFNAGPNAIPQIAFALAVVAGPDLVLLACGVLPWLIQRVPGRHMLPVVLSQACMYASTAFSDIRDEMTVLSPNRPEIDALRAKRDPVEDGWHPGGLQPRKRAREGELNRRLRKG